MGNRENSNSQYLKYFQQYLPSVDNIFYNFCTRSNLHYKSWMVNIFLSKIMEIIADIFLRV